MDWITSHLDLLIGVAAAIAYALNHLRQEAKRKSKADQARPPARSAEPREAAARTAENDERARRIREEIQRKQQERAAGKPARIPEPAMEPPPLFRRPNTVTRPVAPMPLPKLRGAGPAAPAPAAVHAAPEKARVDWKAVRDREQLARLLQQTVGTARLASAPAPSAGPAAPGAAWRAELLRDLRQPHSVRRAVVLSEVLGPPVGMR